ncbi:MAG: hypothetical protein WD024_01425 [Bacillota bacterium]
MGLQKCSTKKAAFLAAFAKCGIVSKAAHAAGVSRRMHYEWQNRYPEFAEALKKNREIVDREVENALLEKGRTP